MFLHALSFWSTDAYVRRLKNRIILAKDQGFQRLWGNGTRKQSDSGGNKSAFKLPKSIDQKSKSQNLSETSIPTTAPSDQNHMLLKEELNPSNVSNKAPPSSHTTVRFAANGGKLDAVETPPSGASECFHPIHSVVLDGCNSTALSIAPTHDDLRGQTPAENYTVHRDDSVYSYASNGFVSPADPTQSTFTAEWRQALRELSAASIALDEARQDLSSYNRAKQQRILNALKISREEHLALAKVMMARPARSAATLTLSPSMALLKPRQSGLIFRGAHPRAGVRAFPPEHV